LSTVIPVAEAVERVVCPFTVRVDAVVVARLEVLVAVSVPVTRLEVVAFPTIRLTIYPVRTSRARAKRFVEVLLVVEALRAMSVLLTVVLSVVRVVIVPVDTESVPMVEEAAVRSVIVVVAKVEMPLTESVPCDVSDEVAVIVPPVIEVLVSVAIKPVRALSVVAKKEEEVAYVVELLVASKVSTIAETALKREAKKFVEVLLVVEELRAEKLLVTVAFVKVLLVA
jgi:hypothetical protein